MRVRHAFTGWTYERMAEGLVRVVDPDGGLEGVFNERAEWQSGALRHADLHMCSHVCGRRAASVPQEGQPLVKGKKSDA